MTTEKRNRLSKKKTAIFIALLVFFIAVFNYPLPFYTMAPGTAVELTPIVEVEDGDRDDEGVLMLTTVRIGSANLAEYLLASVHPNMDLLPKEQLLQEGETDDEYTRRQLLNMENSKEKAMLVAFREAGYDVSLTYKGALVRFVQPDMPAHGVLQIGDRIVELNGTPVKTAEELIDSLEKKKVGEQVELTVVRENERSKKTLTLGELDLPDGTVKPGVGVAIQTDFTFDAPQKVNIKTEDIGGPSAGMMFALEIYNQLIAEDITKGYRIAGTGTIEVNGEVGPIGGIDHKVIAAHQQKADIFLAPAAESVYGKTDYEIALEQKERLHSEMKVVPIKTFADAVEYLAGLEPAN